MPYSPTLLIQIATLYLLSRLTLTNSGNATLLRGCRLPNTAHSLAAGTAAAGKYRVWAPACTPGLSLDHPALALCGRTGDTKTKVVVRVVGVVPVTVSRSEILWIIVPRPAPNHPAIVQRYSLCRSIPVPVSLCTTRGCSPDGHGLTNRRHVA